MNTFLYLAFLICVILFIAGWILRKINPKYPAFLYSIGIFMACGGPILASLPNPIRYPVPFDILSFFLGFLFLSLTTCFFPYRFKKARFLFTLYFHFFIFNYWYFPFRAMATLSVFLTGFLLFCAFILQFVLFLRFPFLKFKVLTIVALFGVMNVFRVASFMVMGGDRCHQILDKQGITPLFTYCEAGWEKKLKEFFPKYKPGSCTFKGARFAYPSYDGRFVYMGTGGCHRDDMLLKYDRKKHKIVKALLVKDTYSMQETIKPHLLFVTAHPSPYMYVVDPLSFKIKKKVKIFFPQKSFKKPRDPGAPMHVIADERTKKIFLGLEHDPYKLLVLSMKDYKEMKILKIIEISAHYMAYSRPLRVLYFTGRARRDYLIAVDTIDYSQNLTPLPGFAIGITIGTLKNLVFVTLTTKGLIGVYEAQNLAPLKFIKAGFGVREIAYDEKHQLLYASNYITGRIKVFDMKKNKLKKEFFVGMRIRRIVYSEKLNRLFVANANGFLEINPERL